MAERFWRHHDPKTGPDAPRAAGPQDRATFAPGDLVRLVARPERVRRVLEVVWHWHRHEFVYVIETRRPCTPAYWFAEQLDRA